MTNARVWLVFGTLGLAVWGLSARAETLVIPPSEVHVTIHRTENQFLDDDWVRIRIQDHERHFEAWDSLKWGNQLEGLLMKAQNTNKYVAVDLDILTTIDKWKDFNPAFRIVDPPAPPHGKEFSVWGFTKPEIANQSFRFCITAVFASGEQKEACPGISTNQYGQFTIDKFTFPATSRADDRVVNYEFALFTAESESPHAPVHKDIFGDAAVANEQHANLEYHIHLASNAATVEADSGAEKRTPGSQQGPAGTGRGGAQKRGTQ